MKSELTRAVADVEPAWPRCPLADLVDDRGITYGVVQPGHPQSEGTPILRVANFTDAGLQLNDVMRIAPAIATRYSRSQLRGGEVLVTLVGSVGQVAVAPPDVAGWNVARAVGVVPVRPELPARWVAWCLQAPQARRYLEARLNTTVQSTLNLRDLASVEIPMPPSRTIRAITSILGALDDKIDSNRRLARLLEEITQTQFQARFVSFVGVDNLTEREQGPIPAGWEWRPVSALARFINGKPFTKFGNGRGRMVIRIADLKSGPGSSTVYTDHEPDSDDFVARRGDILFAWSGSLDVYRWDRQEALINQHVFKVVPEEVPKWLVYFTLKEVMPHFQAIAADKATTMGHIKRSDLARFAIPVPPQEELRQFDSFFSPIFDHSLGAVIEADTLASIRDALLPKLVSGEIRVPETADAGEMIGPLVDEAA